MAIDPATATIIGTAITTVGSVLVAYFQSRPPKPPRKGGPRKPSGKQSKP